MVATTWDQLEKRGFGACWGTGRYLHIILPTNPRDPEYEPYVDFVNPVDFYAVDCNNPDWELLLDLKYGWPENPQPDEEEDSV